MRLKLVPENVDIDWFKNARLTLGASAVAVVLSLVAWAVLGLNFGIDFQGGTTIRSQAEEPVNVAEYRAAIGDLGLGDVVISEVFDPSFGADENVAMIRIAAQDDSGSVQQDTIEEIRQTLAEIAPSIEFSSVESVGPKVSGELIQTAFLAVAASMAAILFYIWLRFEWQFSIGAVAALFHDVILTIGIFSVLQIQFDLATIAAILTIIGYSINDTVVIFDRLRENLIKFKQRPLRDVMNLSVNETLSRTVMTSGTTLVALIALLVLGGDVIRSFVFAITWGIVVGTYSSVFVAKNIVLFLGVKRDWSKPDKTEGNQFSSVDS
ncbi:protein translocase subunit SecF [Palleronia sp.]|uniref:protein translocase subunit SecF n=1 Tax=Palleronia sp. TaxID=1940284 RepID=UPI0035C7D707